MTAVDVTEGLETVCYGFGKAPTRTEREQPRRGAEFRVEEDARHERPEERIDHLVRKVQFFQPQRD